MVKKLRAERMLVMLNPGTKSAIISLAKEAGLAPATLVRQWLQDAMPQLHALTMAAKAARAGRSESAIQILDGLAAQNSEQLDFLGASIKSKVRGKGGKKKAR